MVEVLENWSIKLHEHNFICDASWETSFLCVRSSFDNQQALPLDVCLRWWLNGELDHLRADWIGEKEVSSSLEVVK